MPDFWFLFAGKNLIRTVVEITVAGESAPSHIPPLLFLFLPSKFCREEYGIFAYGARRSCAIFDFSCQKRRMRRVRDYGSFPPLRSRSHSLSCHTSVLFL